MDRKKALKRYLFFGCSLFLCAFGIALVTNARLGTTPITSVPYVLSLLSGLSLGMLTLLVNIVFVALQMLVMREGLSRKYLVQMPVVLVFSVFIDIAMALTRFLPLDGYPLQMAAVVVGSAILGLGIAFEIVCQVAIAYRTRLAVGNVKTLFDCGHVVVAVGLSLLFAGTVLGLREGTVISALLVGNFVRLSGPLAQKATRLWAE
ncbi:DUF6198 family protein [Nitratidesulfovibrio liaohensis]|uniref:DUF6198 family protein n=1 Tax=Nitratidesulfovibrio liaohensis TaxID=2604158 RepID=A0ABY9R1T5_9BACT|nr:DUF6198 family protein [Nitratidesulfovibrio liaohensis]WMW65726.1 DUF6198 family protein [Nitratidesulfovibrio liaohensis]